jgi:hypothetical protein
MKEYYYSLDEFNRFTEIHEITEENREELSYYLLGEFDENDVANIVLCETGLVNNQIKYIGEQEVEKKQREEYTLVVELKEIKEWFLSTDWIPNKIITGEWTNNDKRWTTYLKERTAKRKRQDELKEE